MSTHPINFLQKMQFKSLKFENQGRKLEQHEQVSDDVSKNQPDDDPRIPIPLISL
jgi:hypothetical protein